MKENSMVFNTIKQALLECATNNYIITSPKLSPGESIHCYNGAIYYEDGCMIGNNINTAYYFLNGTEWARDTTWHVLYKLDDEDIERLNYIHKSCNGLSIGFDSKFKIFIDELELKYN